MSHKISFECACGHKHDFQLVKVAFIVRFGVKSIRRKGEEETLSDGVLQITAECPICERVMSIEVVGFDDLQARQSDNPIWKP